ncbi:MAG: ATP-binding protein [Chloroflexia bacterium]|nr:ATP-binding protein [Chloroflexia bacterium]
MEARIDLTTRIEEQIQALQGELEKLRRELQELNVVIPQNSVEVDRLSQRELSISSRMREMELNLDNYPRTDIKQFYTSLHEVQLRHYMMRTQLEQQQSKQKTLQARQKEIQNLILLFETLQEQGTGGRTARQLQSQDDTSEQELISKIIQAQEEERLRISQQIHDGPTQTMSNLVLQAEVCERFVDKDPVEAKTELTSLKTTIHHTLQVMRRFIFDVRPMILDDLGLVPTLRRYIQDFSERTSVETNLVVQGVEGRLPAHLEISIFRLIQEALTNVSKHAHAPHARVALELEGHQIVAIVEDDGVGFNIEEMEQDRRQGQRRMMGIANMRQRVETLLKGQLIIESTPGRGTRVIATIPMQELGEQG